MYERFTKEARAVVVQAADEALELGDERVGPEHLLLALTLSHGAAERALADSGLDHGAAIEALEREWRHSLAFAGVVDAPSRWDSPASRRGRVPFARPTKDALEGALRAALERGDRRIASGHVLLGVLRAEAGTVPRALAVAGVDRGDLVARVHRAIDQPTGSE